MGAPASIIILFGLSCLEPCALDEAARVQIEQTAVKAMAARGFEVKPAPEDAPRPTGPEATEAPGDVARRLGAARVVVLDVEPKTTRLWMTHYVRGTLGPWAVKRHTCSAEPEDPCPGFTSGLLASLRPRKADDVDFVGLLRSAAPGVGACVLAEDKVPAALRIFGRVEVELEVTSDGLVRVASVAPARAARGELGACLRRTFAKLEVGPFDGEPVRLRVPIDL